MANPLYGQNKADDKLDLLKSGKNLGVKTLTTATTLTAEDAGKLIVVNAAAIEVTLPTAEAGLKFDFVFLIDTTAGATIVASSGDCFFGTIKVFSTTADQGAVQQVISHAGAIASVTDYDNIDLVHDSNTLGGKAGDTVRLIAVDDTAWLAEANLVTDGANPGTIAVINAG
tara:strand:- start:48 stop:560 length:513 start_codon:yes stop_codon:yes gene_type:complete